jgi:hypothetical protein
MRLDRMSMDPRPATLAHVHGLVSADDASTPPAPALP